MSKKYIDFVLTDDKILEENKKYDKYYYDLYSSKIDYNFIEWDNTIYKQIKYSDAIKLQTDILIIPSYTEFYNIAENHDFGGGTFWGREIYPNSDLLVYGYQITFRYKCLLYIPDRLANLRLIKISKKPSS